MPTIVVKFKQQFPLELVASTLDSGFVGLCASVRPGDDPRTVVMHPTAHEYRNVKGQLEELEREGALSFQEVVRYAP